MTMRRESSFRAALGIMIGIILLTSCAGPDPAELSEATSSTKLATHLLVLDSRGRTKLLDSQRGSPPGPVWEPWPGEDASEGYMELKHKRTIPIELMFTNFANDFAKNEKTDKLLFYFNGGLGQQDNLVVRANDQHDRMESSGYYPLFMIWPTGPLDTYYEQVFKTYNGRYYYTPQRVRGTLRVVTNVLQGLASTPSNWLYDTARFTQAIVFKKCEFFVNDRKLRTVHDATPEEVSRGKDCLATDINGEISEMSHWVRQGDTSDHENHVIMSPSVNAEPNRRTDFFWLTATTVPRILSVPLAEGIGTEAWKNMQRRTKTTVRADQEVEGNDSGWDELRARYPKGAGGFAQFFALLEACTRDKSIAPPERTAPCPSAVTDMAKSKLKKTPLTLIGHSMGAIVINEIAMRFPELNYRDLVFLSGAATVRETEAALGPLLERKNGSARFFNLMLHPMNEAREIHAKGSIPSGSLLVWIDEMLENPNTAIDRTVGQWVNMQPGRRHFSAEARRWMQLKVFDWIPRTANGQVLSIIEHGQYNQTGVRFWERSFWSTETGDRCAQPVRFANESAPLPIPEDCPLPAGSEISASLR